MMKRSAEDAGSGAGMNSAAFAAWLAAGAILLIGSRLSGLVYPAAIGLPELCAAAGALLLMAPILAMAMRDAFRAELHMSALVTVAVMAAFVRGEFAAAGWISFLMLLAISVESRAAAGAHAAIEALIRIAPQLARRIGPDGAESETPAGSLCVGERIRVRPGEIVPSDGVIVEGRTALNEATITGESLPADKEEGAEVFAGTENLTGSVVVEVRRVGADTTLERVRDLILSAERTRLPVTRLIDRYIGYYVPAAFMLSVLAWAATGEVQRAIAILVVACPCALVLSTPSAIMAALSAAARAGVLVKNAADLERAGRIDAVVLDKTGTLTTAQLAVERLAPDGVEPSDLLAWAVSAERYSKHPAALALLRLAKEANVALSEPSDFAEEAGWGVSARVGGAVVLAGRDAWLERHGVSLPAAAVEAAGAGVGLSVVHVARGGRYAGWIGFQDAIRAGAAECLRELSEIGVRRVAMFTGDRQSVAEYVAAKVGCREVAAHCLPQDKVAVVSRIRADGHLVAVVGDGINDAPALASGDFGIAMAAAGSEVAIHSAVIALMNSDLRRIPFLIRLSRAMRSVVFQNLALSTLFMLAGLTLSGVGYLTAIAAAVLHNVGSLAVIVNSARLVRIQPER